MSLATLLLAQVKSKVTTYGTTVSFNNVAVAAYDAATSAAVPTPTTTTVPALIIKRSKTVREGGGTRTTVQLLIPAESLAAAAVGDNAVFEGERYAVDMVDPQYVEGTIVFWNVFLGK